jgi:hypothetical protein
MTAAFPTDGDGRCRTVEAHLTLARARELALAHGQISAGVQAEHYRGKAAGLYEDRIRLESGPSDNVLLIVVVRSWHLADSFSGLALGPLLGVEQPLPINRWLYGVTA